MTEAIIIAVFVGGGVIAAFWGAHAAAIILRERNRQRLQNHLDWTLPAYRRR